MFAIVATGGRQYVVRKDDTLIVNRLTGGEGDKVVLEDVVCLGEGGKEKESSKAKVIAVIEAHTLGEKVLTFKKRRRKNSQRIRGHRQHLTHLKIKDIMAS